MISRFIAASNEEQSAYKKGHLVDVAIVSVAEGTEVFPESTASVNTVL